MQVTIKSGFCFETSEELGNNMELLECLAEMDSGDIMAMSKVCKIVLGEDGKKKLYDHLRTEDGRVPVEAIASAIKEIFESVGKKGKNF